MLACKGVFVKPSIPQAHICAHSTKYKDLRSKAFCGYYITFCTKSQAFGTRILQKESRPLASTLFLSILFY